MFIISCNHCFVLVGYSASIALAGAASGRTGAAIAINDAAFGQVIGRHFDAYGVADDRPDAKTSHPACRISDDPMIIFQNDAEAPVGKDFIDLAVEGQ